MTKKDIIERLKSRAVSSLIREADKVRKICCGDTVFIRSVIEFSSFCCRNCFYCGLRRGNAELIRYRMDADEIIRAASRVLKTGIKTIILQSGDDFYYSRKKICEIVEKIKNKDPGTAITLSVGERPFEDYRAFIRAGADRYLLKIETASPSLYTRLHPGQSLEKRLKNLYHLKDLGYQTGTGNIVGLPFQTEEDLARDILFFRKFQPDMIGIGPFMPQRDTPLGAYSPGLLQMTLKVLALTRIVTKNAHLPATTALATLDPSEGQLLGLKAGCNVIMLNFTPPAYRKKYRIYDNKQRIDLQRAETVVRKAGRVPSVERGDALRKDA
jgi:biotin synthase